MIIAYLIASVTIALLLFVCRNRVASIALMTLFVLIQCSLTVYEFIIKDMADAVYFKPDALALIMLSALTVVTIPALIHKSNYINPEDDSPRVRGIYQGAMVLLVMALSAAYLSSHIAVTWIFVEITTLSASALVFHRRNAGSIEATWKYIFVCSISLVFVFIGILLLGISLGNAQQFDLQYDMLVAIAPSLDTFWIKIAFVFIFAGYTAKFGLVPMYTAGIDAKDKAPAPAAGLFSSVLMNVGFVGVFRMWQIVAHTSVLPWAANVVTAAALLSVVVAAVYLIKVKNVKRMLAYSSVEHMGVVALGLAAGGVGYFAAILHLVLHTFAKSALFFQVGHIYRIYHTKNIYHIGNYLKYNRAGAVLLLLGFVCITATPPSGLFISELMVFKSIFEAGSFIALAFALILLTIIIWALGKNFFKMLFTPAPTCGQIENVKVSTLETATQFVLLALVFWLGLCPPQCFVDLINEAVQLLTH